MGFCRTSRMSRAEGGERVRQGLNTERDCDGQDSPVREGSPRQATRVHVLFRPSDLQRCCPPILRTAK